MPYYVPAWDHLRAPALRRATAALGRPRPFLLYLAPAAPHLESSPQRPMAWTTPRPAGRHASLYADENVSDVARA